MPTSATRRTKTTSILATVLQAVIGGLIGVIPKLVATYMAYRHGKTVAEVESSRKKTKAMKEWAKYAAEEITPEEAYDWFIKKEADKKKGKKR